MASLARSNELVKIFPSKQEAAARSDAGRSQLAAHHRGHRRLLVDALTVRGVGVVRIFDAHKSEPHQLTPFLRVDGEQLLYAGLV